MTPRRAAALGLALALAGAACGGGAPRGGALPPDASPGDADASPGDDAAPDDAPLPPPGVTVTEAAGELVLDAGPLRVRADLAAGTFDVRGADGTLHLLGADARAAWTEGGAEKAASTRSPGTTTWRVEPLDDALGTGLALVLERALDAGPVLALSLDLRAGATFLTATVTLRWPGGAPAATRVASLSPLAARGEDGGALFVGAEPFRHVVLDNGFDLYFDFEARAYEVGGGTSLLFPPGSASNWSAAVRDPATGRSVVAGFLSFDRGVGLVCLDHAPGLAREDAGRRSLTRFEGLVTYLDGRAPLADGDGAALASETLYVDLAPPSASEGLEAYARRFALRAGRPAPDVVPSGWNSWGGGAGSGGYGTAIDEPLMLANLAAAEEDWRPWGMTHFLVDDGWQVATGDWQTHPTRFPPHDGVDGMAWLAAQARAAGFLPGIWIAAFTADTSSALAQEHPDWLADVHPFGSGLVPSDQRPLDLTHPEVLAHLEALFRRLVDDWGYRWIKLDFAYYALFATGLHDPDVTPSEAYRRALERLRGVIGPDTFLLTVAATGLSFGVADGNRITLDNEPWWEDDGSFGAQSIRGTYRTVARRWWMGHALWLNPPDLLFFRDDYGLTLEEARAWTSVVALTGGIVKLGESYLAMHDHPAWRALVQPLLPPWSRTARPLDVFSRELPEVWRLDAEREGRTWRVVGLFHWGRNRDIGADAWEPEAPRTLAVPLADLGLAPGARHLVFGAWDHAWTWLEGPTLEAALAPRSGRVLVVREAPAAPAVVFTTRHLLGGVVEVHDEAWSEADGALSFRVDTVPGAPFTAWVAPAGRPLAAVEAPGAADVAVAASDGLVAVSFVPTAATTHVRLSP